MNEVVHETAPGSAGASSSLSECPCAICAHLWHFPRLMDHLWKHIKPHIAGAPVTQTVFQGFTNLTASLIYATPCWMRGFEPPSTGLPMPPTPAQLGCTLPCAHHRER